MAAAVDVIVTDGFTGNVALKTLEGAMRFASSELRTALTSTRAARLGAPCSGAGCASSATASSLSPTAARRCSAWAAPS